MTTQIPVSITRDQMLAACRALGLDPALVVDLYLDHREGATIGVYVRSAEGQVLARGDNAVTAHVFIPLAPAPPAAAHRGTHHGEAVRDAE